MYKILGADGKEYGPVTPDQLRQWFTEGRVNAQTQVQAEGSTEWKPLISYPDLAAVLPSAAPPVVATVDAEKFAAEILARDYHVNVGDCFSRGWELVKANFWLLVGASFVAGIIASGGGLPYIGPLIGMIIGGPMMGGLFLFYLKKIRGQPAEFGDIFLGFKLAFLPLMLANIVIGLLCLVGLILLIIPGIYLAVCWGFALTLVIDKRLDFWQAMELSRKVVNKHWWQIFGLMVVCFLVMFAGLFACCVGAFVTGAIAEGAWLYAYEDIFGDRPAPAA